MSLSISHRPESIDTFIGNDDLVVSLESILERKLNKVPHVFMFTGQSGCGKTTLARIVAKELGCSITSEFYEYNAASVRGIDSIREIERNCKYPPMNGECRVWLFDEIHQYRSDTQEAMLKMLEDAPEHAFFILCTTDPQKLKKTLIGRCVKFEVKPLDDDEMFELLGGIAKTEKTKIPEKVLRRIYNQSEGSPRNAIQLLDKIIDLDEEDMLDSVDKAMDAEKQSIDLCRALIGRKSWKEVTSILKNLQEEPETVRYVVLGYANSVLLSKINNQAALIIECFSEPFYNSGKAGLTLACYQCLN